MPFTAASVRLVSRLVNFGCGQTVGRIRETAYRGLKRVDQHFKLRMAASNVVRMGHHTDGSTAGGGNMSKLSVWKEERRTSDTTKDRQRYRKSSFVTR